MSRLRYAALSLSSGCAAMCRQRRLLPGLDTALALHYLGKEEVRAVGRGHPGCRSYLLLLDFGVFGSVSRILIDHKDNKETGRYGSVIKTGCSGAAGCEGLRRLGGNL